MSEPEDRYFESMRLRLHYTVWGDEAKPPLLLVHGGRDHARSWDFVAQKLTDRYAVYCPDLRGHGDSDWATGGAYSLSNYIADFGALVEAIGRGPVRIVAHSLGGRITTDYACAYPENVIKVVNIEGTGIFRPQGSNVERLRKYVADAADISKREPRRYATIEAAAERMHEENTRLSPEMTRHLTEHAVRRLEDGSYVWKFDNYVRLQRIDEPSVDDAKALWANLKAPLLFVAGSESWWSKMVNREDLVGAMRGSRTVIFDKAGHWVHHDQLEEFATLVRDFFDEA